MTSTVRRATGAAGLAAVSLLYLSLATFPEFSRGRVVMESSSGPTPMGQVTAAGTSPWLGVLLVLGAAALLSAAVAVITRRRRFVAPLSAVAVLSGLLVFAGLAALCVIVAVLVYRATGDRPRR